MFAVLEAVAAVAFAATGAPENIARGRAYELSRPPNYVLSQDAGDAVQLTDGTYAGAGGNFMWTDKRAVTWRKCEVPIGVTVDLGRVEPIAGFSMDFAAGASGVPYPNAILVYTSDDGAKWRYLGDLYAKSRLENGAPQMNGYEKYVARSRRMPSTGRYVKFVVSSGTYFCTSEVEVYRGPAVKPTAANVSDPIRYTATGRIVGRILRDLDRLAPEDDDLRERISALAADEDLSDIETKLPLNALHAEVWAKNAAKLRQAGFAKPALWANDRWENLDPLAIPPRESSGKVALAVEMMRGETRSTAVNVVNPTDAALTCELTVDGLPASAAVDCREVIFTDTKLQDPVSGALRPGEGNRVTFTIPSGASKQVWIAFARPKAAAGTYGGRIRASFGGKAPDLSGEIVLKVRDLDFPSRPRIHVGGWDYSYGDCSTYRAPGNAKANQAMMREIYADVFWANRAVLPKGAKFGPSGELLNAAELDFAMWDEWTARFPDARRYAVFPSVNGLQTKDGRYVFEGEPVGTARFNRMVGDYYRALRDHVRGQGIDPRKVMLLIVDEPAEWQQRYRELPGLIVAWAKAIKAAVPEFTIWEDPDYSGDPRQAGPEMYEVCDALSPQVLKAATPGKGPALSRAFFVPLADQGKEMWFYSCSGPSRTFDPITYYRQMFWLAYQWKAVGCEYWAFGCGGGIGDSWHAYRQKGVEYSPYFVSPTGVMAAKQSEGIKEGVQDYEYLKMLEDAIRAAKVRGVDVTAAERLLETAPAKALNQTGGEGREKYVRADPVEWNLPKDRGSVEEARLEVLRELDRLVHDKRGRDLSENFRNPPDSAKPHTWWHWMNGNISKEGITADLEAMREIGLGGAQIFDIDYGIPRGKVDFNSAEWRDCVKHAAYEARRLGLELVLNTASGWSCAGAPWTAPEDGMKFLTCREKTVRGPCRFDERIAEPPFNGNYGKKTLYGDIAALAYPTPQKGSAAPLERFSTQIFRCRDQSAAQFRGRFDKLDIPGGLVPADSVVDLTKYLKPDGRITWDVPEGEWTILRIGWNANGRVNYPPSACGSGLECDKLSARALEAHWAGLMDPLLKELAPVTGRRDGKGGITGIVIDSYEAGSQNWTPGLEREFEMRTGYSIVLWLPVFAGRVVGSKERSERFLEDFRRVVSDVFVENFGFASRRKAHAYGLELYVEPYGDDLPANGYEYARCADIPMSEFWCHPKGASAWKGGPTWGGTEAHVWGKPVVGAEAFTTWPQDGRWTQDPWSLKRENDQAYVHGVNRMIYHTYAHQPWSDPLLKPGMTMGRFGVMFNRNVTWWRQGRAWIDYQTRCQYLLQQGTAVSDALYFCGERSPEAYVRGRRDIPDGSDFDVLTRNSLLACRAENGEIVTPGGMRCGILLMPDENRAMSPDLLRQVEAFAAAGVTVVGDPPERSFGLRGGEAADAEVRALAARIWSRPNVRRRPTSAVLKEIGHTCDFIAPKGPVVQHIHRRADDGSEIYFVAQYTDGPIEPECSFRVKGRVPELWNPETGEMSVAAEWREVGGRTAVKLRLSPRGSVFVVFRPKATAGLKTEPRRTVVATTELDGPWQVTFRSERGAADRTLEFDRLRSWTEHPDEEVRFFSGTAVYRRTFGRPAAEKGDRVVLYLGAVKNIATVRVNGRVLRTLWKPPFELDVTDALADGENRLEIVVVNTWANRLIGDEARPDDCTWVSQRWSGPHLETWPGWMSDPSKRPSGRTTFATWHHWTKDDKPLDSGIMGPVKLRVER